MTYRRSDLLHIVGYSDNDYVRDDRKLRIDMYSLSQRGSYFMEKLKANRHYIVHNMWQFIACYEATAGELTKEVHTRFEGGWRHL